MKKVWIFFLFIALLMAGLAGCSSNDKESSDENEDVETSAPVEEEEDEEEEEEDGDVVTIVFPASLNENGEVEDMTAEIQEAGATNIEKNSDGSVTVEISQEALDALLEKYHSEMMTMIEDINSQAGSGETSIKDLSYDEETFQEFNITVDRAAYESADNMDGLIVFGLAMQSLMYQVYSGVDEADIQVTFNWIDESTGEVFDTNVLPEQ